MVEKSNDEREGASRGEKKRAARAVEALAVRMVESSAALCKQLPLSEELRVDLDQARRIKARGARKRQIKHLAGLLRRDEESAMAIQAALDAEGRSDRTQQEYFHHLEEFRDALCDEGSFAGAIEKAVEEMPGLDRQTITRLASRFHQTGDKRASREIFRRLRALSEPPSGV